MTTTRRGFLGFLGAMLAAPAALIGFPRRTPTPKRFADTIRDPERYNFTMVTQRGDEILDTQHWNWDLTKVADPRWHGTPTPMSLVNCVVDRA